MSSKKAIEQQLERLGAEREKLADLLIQRAKLGSAYAPPAVSSGIREARDAIRQVKTILRGWGVQVEDQLDDESPVQERTISTKPLFDPNTVLLVDASIYIIASHLYEWKIVHSTVQGLLLSVVPIEKAMRMAESQLTDESIHFIEEMWYPSCNKRSEKILVAFDGLAVIRHRVIDDLYTIIGSKMIERNIKDLQPNNKETLRLLKQNFDTLLDALRDVMVVTDLYITQIADSLKLRNMEN